MRQLFGLAMAFVLVLTISGVADAASDGKALYGSKCAMCHGNDGVPKKMAEGSKAFSDPEFKKTATVESIVKDTVDGKGKMKPIKNLTPEDTKAIADYILTMAEKK